MLIALLAIPLLAAFASWFIPADAIRRILLLLVSGAELILALACWFVEPASFGGDLLAVDAMGRLVLTVTCALFFASSVYAVGYLRGEDRGDRKDFQQGLHFSNAPEATFTACLLLFLASAVLVTITRHFGLLWVGIETTTIVSAPLIYFHRHQRSLEATWKYLLICSVGIALALMGNLLMDVSIQPEGHFAVPMTLEALLENAPRAHPIWLKAAFVFLLIGYGTKMGVAPMHTWLPDAHSEAPSLVSALLSGALLNCAFLGIFRSYEVCVAANLGAFASDLLLAFGFLSMLVAALFIVGIGDFKRMLAYSSVEHMGILLIALGTGLEAARGGMLHMVNHSLAKAGLFLLAGNILTRYSTKSSHDVTGLNRVLPLTGPLWLAGIIAITGSPPFALFISEFSILKGLLHRGQQWLALAYLLLLGIIFVGMLTPCLRMCRGKAPPGLVPQKRESLLLVAPSACLLLLVLVLGLIMPDFFSEALNRAAAMVSRP
ncbi:NADH dehydrogenase FAD-containing subunit [Desulfovibrio sp. OttesenSCG-928-A18]|nr:NADH dehydrogenase FAD-containing subunit [Desulfovibrio sp. OttesenSCG-928-A18]